MAREPAGRQGKKLIGAGRHWAKVQTGRREDVSVANKQAELFGLPAEAQIKPKAPEVFDVWPENAEALKMFLRMDTQWRTSMGGVVGLDLSVLLGGRGLAELAEGDPIRVLYDDVRLIETGVLMELAEARG
jgi:hypothetical protein